MNGAVVWSARYEAFGKADVQVETVVNHLRFPGQYEDAETGLHYNYFRYYDPKVGRYTKVDPIGFLGGLNIFSYVENQPIGYSDPWGLMHLTEYSPSTTCEIFVEALISDYRSSVSTWYFNNFSLGIKYLEQIPFDCVFRDKVTGFKPEFTSGGQGPMTGCHIWANAGISLTGSMIGEGMLVSDFIALLHALQRFWDPDKTWEESNAEVACDIAGQNVAGILKNWGTPLVFGNDNSEYIRDRLRELLCQ